MKLIVAQKIRMGQLIKTGKSALRFEP